MELIKRIHAMAIISFIFGVSTINICIFTILSNWSSYDNSELIPIKETHVIHVYPTNFNETHWNMHNINDTYYSVGYQHDRDNEIDEINELGEPSSTTPNPTTTPTPPIPKPFGVATMQTLFGTLKACFASCAMVVAFASSIQIVTGLMVADSEANNFHINIYFWFKMNSAMLIINLLSIVLPIFYEMQLMEYDGLRITIDDHLVPNSINITTWNLKRDPIADINFVTLYFVGIGANFTVLVAAYMFCLSVIRAETLRGYKFVDHVTV